MMKKNKFLHIFIPNDCREALELQKTNKKTKQKQITYQVKDGSEAGDRLCHEEEGQHAARPEHAALHVEV